MTTNPLVRAGEQIHFYESMSIPTSEDLGVVVARGDTITVTDKLIEASLDRDGNSWLDYVGDDSGQLDAWGVVRFRPGPFPTDESRWVHGSADWIDARKAAHAAMWALTDPSAQQAAHEALMAEFGAPPTTQVTGKPTR